MDVLPNFESLCKHRVEKFGNTSIQKSLILSNKANDARGLMKKKNNESTSWHKVGKWYNDSVGDKGHYYHEHVILPNLLRLFNFSDTSSSSLLDLACGQGILSRAIPSQVNYQGVDLATSLINSAKQYKSPKNHRFILGDVTQELPLEKNSYTHAAIILAIQNIEKPWEVFKNASRYLKENGTFILVLNHPCFRIPRQSSWKVDEENSIQFRRIDRYMSPMKIPIQAAPSQKEKSAATLSFHHPISDYSKWLNEAGFAIISIEEWCSDKLSEGRAAKMENRARQEIPLFMAIVARKLV